VTDDSKDGPLGFGADPPEPREPDAAEGTGTAGSGPDPDRYAHRRDPDLEAYGISTDRRPDLNRRPPPARPPVGTSRYTWFVGVVAVLVIAYVSVNSVTNKGPGSRGVEVGSMAPPFAAPLATGDLSGDVNVARRTKQGKAGDVPACSIHRPDVLTICDLWRDRPVVLAFFATRGSSCTKELDTLQRIAQGRPDVAVAAIAIRGSRGDVRKQIRGGGWTFPVGYDHDGVLANLYSVAICPQLAFIRRGGVVAGTTFGAVPEARLRARIATLVAGRPLPKDG
jgi:peroxiredoxin